MLQGTTTVFCTLAEGVPISASRLTQLMNVSRRPPPSLAPAVPAIILAFDVKPGALRVIAHCRSGQGSTPSEPGTSSFMTGCRTKGQAPSTWQQHGPWATPWRCGRGSTSPHSRSCRWGVQLYFTALHSDVRHCTVLHCTALHCTVLHTARITPSLACSNVLQMKKAVDEMDSYRKHSLQQQGLAEADPRVELMGIVPMQQQQQQQQPVQQQPSLQQLLELPLMQPVHQLLQQLLGLQQQQPVHQLLQQLGEQQQQLVQQQQQPPPPPPPQQEEEEGGGGSEGFQSPSKRLRAEREVSASDDEAVRVWGLVAEHWESSNDSEPSSDSEYQSAASRSPSP